MVRSVHLSLAGLVVASAASVGTGAASPERQAPTSFVDAGLSAAFAELTPVEGGDDFQPASDPSVPDVGTPNPILRASVLTFRLGRAPEAGDLQVDPELGIDVLNNGSIEFGANQQTATIVMVETDRPPTEGGNAVDNLSLAYNFPGQAVLEESPFANDPLIGFGTVLDRGSAQGQDFSSFQQIVDGQWQPYGDPIHTVGFSVEAPVQGFAPGGSSSRYVTASVLFGPASRIAWISSHAGSAVAEALYSSIVELEPPEVFLDPADVTTMEPLSSSIVRGPFCGPDEVLDDGLCVPRCGDGFVLDGDVCVPVECADGEFLDDGVCTPVDEAFPPLVCDQLGGSILEGGCTVTGLAEQPCADGGGAVTGDVCMFADPPDETECGWLGSEYRWSDTGCGLLAGGASDSETDGGAASDSAVGLCQPYGEPGDGGSCLATGLPAGACGAAGGLATGDVCEFASPVVGEQCLVLGYGADDDGCTALDPPFPPNDCSQIGSAFGDACLVEVDSSACSATGNTPGGVGQCVVASAPDEAACSTWGNAFTFSAGLCLAATGAAIDEPPVDTPDEGSGGSLISILLVALGGLVVLALIGWWFWWRPRSGDSNTPSTSPPVTTATLTRAEREALVYANRGIKTPFMTEWGLAADIALGDAFEVRGLVGRWVFFQSDPFLVTPDEDIPEGATVVQELPDGEGTLVTVQGAHRQYRIGADGSFLGSFITDPTPAASILTVQFAHDEESLNIPVAWGNVWDKGSRRLFTSVSSRPTDDVVDAVLAEHGGEIYPDGDLSEPLPEWQALHPTDLNQAMQIMAERIKAGGVVMADGGDPPAILAGTSIYLPVVLLGALAAADPIGDGAPTTVAPGDRFTGDDYVPEYFLQNDWFLSLTERGSRLAFTGSFRQSAVDAALAAGATPNADGWVPVTGEQWYDAALMPEQSIVPRPSDAGFNGIFINVHTLEEIHPKSIDMDPDDSVAEQWVRLMGEQGLDPFADAGGHVMAAFEEAAYVFVYDAEGKPYLWYRYGDAETPSASGPMGESAGVPGDAERAWDRLHDNMELNDTIAMTDMVICM